MPSLTPNLTSNQRVRVRFRDQGEGVRVRFWDQGEGFGLGFGEGGSGSGLGKGERGGGERVRVRVRPRVRLRVWVRVWVQIRVLFFFGGGGGFGSGSGSAMVPYVRTLFRQQPIRNLLDVVLRGPAILFILRNTFSDSIAKLFRACFSWGIAQVSRDMLQNGVSH